MCDKSIFNYDYLCSITADNKAMLFYALLIPSHVMIYRGVFLDRERREKEKWCTDINRRAKAAAIKKG
jgi:hypothetical protein